MEEMFEIVNIESIKKEPITGTDTANSFCNEGNENELCETDPIQLNPDTALNLNSENEVRQVTDSEKEIRLCEFEKQTLSNSNDSELCETDPIELPSDTALNLNSENEVRQVTDSEKEIRFCEFEKQTLSNCNDSELCETDPIQLPSDTALNLNSENEVRQVTDSEKEIRFCEFEKQTLSNCNDSELCETDPIQLPLDTALNLNPENIELRVTDSEEEISLNDSEKQIQVNDSEKQIQVIDSEEEIRLSDFEKQIQVDDSDEEIQLNDFEKQIQNNDSVKEILNNGSEHIKTEPKEQLDESLSCEVSVSFQKFNKSRYVVCDICNRLFTNNFRLKQHSVVHKIDHRICGKCSKSFKYLSDFRKHKKRCRVCKCNICNEIFNTSKDLQKHIGVHIHTGFNCLICKEIFVQEDEFKKHMEVHKKTNLKTEQSNEIYKKSVRSNLLSTNKTLKLDSQSDEEPTEKRTLRSTSTPGKRSLRQDSWSGDEKTEKRTLRSQSIFSNKKLKFDSSSDDEISERNSARSKRNLRPDSSSNKQTSKKRILRRNSMSSKSLRLDLWNDEKETLQSDSECSNKRLRLSSLSDEEISENKSLPSNSLSSKRTLRKNASMYYEESASSEDNYNIKLLPKKISTFEMASSSKYNTNITNTQQTNEPRKFNYECEECNKKFLFESGLIQHKKNYSTYNCSLCHITFPERNGLEMHIREHNNLPENLNLITARNEQKVDISNNVDEIPKKREMEQPPNECIKCDKVFQSKEKYLNHWRTYIDRNDIYKCPNCNIKYHENRFLKSHMMACSVTQRNTKKNKVDTKCVKCDKIFKNKQNYIRHCVTYMGMDEIYQCPNCDEKFHENKYLQMHLRVCSGSKNNTNQINEVEKQDEKNSHTNKCTICEEIFSTRLSYLCHCEAYMGKEVHTCSKCDMKFHEYRRLESHSKKCSGKINTENVDTISKKKEIKIKKELILNKCFKCEKVLPSQSSYLHHIQLYKNKYEIFECSHCSEKFHENTHLEKHMKTCNDAAKTNTERLVNRVKKFKRGNKSQFNSPRCEICRKLFSSKHSLLRHCNTYGKEVHACSKCGKKFHESKYLKIHQNDCLATINNIQNETIKNKNVQFECVKCERIFSHRNGYIIHMNSYKHTDEIYECSNCTKKFHKENYLKDHLRKCVGSINTHLKNNEVKKLNSYKCVKCEMVIEDKQSYLDHIETYKDKDEIFECSDCKEKFHENENLKRHLSICTVRVGRNTQNEINNAKGHKKQEENKCVKCEKVFSQRDSYLRHLEAYKYTDDIFECTNCTEKFHDERYLKNHLRQCVGTIRTDINTEACETEVKKLLFENKCVKCEKVMENRQSYLDHIELYKGQDEIFECSNCSEKFHENKNLEKHLKTCIEVASTTIQNDENKCTKCERVFSSKRNFERHIETYKGRNEIYECYNCFTKFHNSNYFKSHMKKCSTEEVKEHKNKVKKVHLLSTKCQTCGKVLANRKSYLRHMQVYADKDIYACSYCGQKFHEKALLKSHVSAHTGVVEHEWYHCNICMRNFKHKYLLQRHLETLHSVNIKKELINEPAPSFI